MTNQKPRRSLGTSSRFKRMSSHLATDDTSHNGGDGPYVPLSYTRIHETNTSMVNVQCNPRLSVSTSRYIDIEVYHVCPSNPCYASSACLSLCTTSSPRSRGLRQYQSSNPRPLPARTNGPNDSPRLLYRRDTRHPVLCSQAFPFSSMPRTPSLRAWHRLRWVSSVLMYNTAMIFNILCS